MKPARSAPASAAASTSSWRVRPQTLTSGREISSFSLAAGSGGAHQRRSNQYGACSSQLGRRALGTRPDSALGHDHTVARDAGDELELGAAVDREVDQVTAVDAQTVGAQSQATLQLFGVVRLDQRIQSQLGAVGAQARHLLIGEIAQDQQEGVGASTCQLADLSLLAEEALADQRRAGRRAGCAQVVDRTGEALVHQHRDRRRARLGEVLRQSGRIGVRAQLAGRGRLSLDLGDRLQARSGECFAEAPHHELISD